MTSDPVLAPFASPQRRVGRRRLFCLLGLLVVLALVAGVFKAWGVPYAATWQTRADARDAIESLQAGDLVALDRQLLAHRADPVFAYYFTGKATPRDLGDALATVADSTVRTVAVDDPDAGETLPAGAGSDASAYERTLTDLADTLALATRGTGDLVLPSSWIDAFTAATTNPVALYGDESGSDQARVDQDVANKQNLLLLLSRGRWSTSFLQATTQAYWDWEHDPANAAGPGAWPGPVLADATYARTPDGTYLTDGMVALLAALTANPEAAGWAFADFQPDTTTFTYGGADHPIGTFTHFLFFGHDYAQDPNTGTATLGSTAAVTALLSAIQATGGSYADNATGPLADLHVLQDAQQGEADSSRWYQKIGRFLQDWGQVALDAIGLIPGVGIVPDVASAIWSAIEGDWIGAGLSALAVIPVVGAIGVSAKLIKNGLHAGRMVNRAGEVIDGTTDAGRLLAKATGAGDGLFDYDNAADFIAALKNPVPGVTYKYGDTSYELAPDGKTLTHLSGPDQNTIKRNLPSEENPGRNQLGECISGECRAASKLKEEQGINLYEKKNGLTCLRDQVKSTITGLANSRLFDALCRKPDGTFVGLEVKSGQAKRSLAQSAFDERVTDGNPAMAILDGQEIRITSVALQTVS